MPTTLGVFAARQAPAEVSVVGLPVFAGAAGPELFPSTPTAIGSVTLPTELDAEWCRRQGFTAKTAQTLSLRQIGLAPLVLIGLGDREVSDPDRWRRAAAAFVRHGGEGGTAAFHVPALEGDAWRIGSAIAEGACLAAYRFDEFKSSSRPSPLDALCVVPAEGDRDVLARGIERGARVATAVAFARDLINTPPSALTPARLADRVSDALGAIDRVSVEVWDEERIRAERLGGLLGVSRGSPEAPRFVRATYEPSDTGAPFAHVVLVGKGITFDSGGLSLKTADGMTTMKTDMSGAAIVLSALGACADLDVPGAAVTALAPITENMPGGAAIKPGDVLTIRSGATIEVLNTDAEGRLVLADALSLATELEPDAIIDIATLTGAVRAPLGNSIAGLFGNDQALIDRVRRGGLNAGEILWPLPLPEEYADHIDSDVADMKNVGKSGQAGAIAAALLLSRFVGTVPWAHLDIAGTGRSTESTGYLSKGGTAFGVRTLLEVLTSFGEGTN